jgi:enoyl-[acyl-carrier protein] reductase I
MDKLVLENKKGIILGVRTRRSIAYAVAWAMYHAGAQLLLTYESEHLKEKLRDTTKGKKNVLLEKCDVTNEHDIIGLFSRAKDEFGNLDFLVHSIAYAPEETFKKPVTEATDEEFYRTLKISAKSLADLTSKAVPLMHNGSSIVAMTYLGGKRVIPPYKLMGVAKATLDAFVISLAEELGGKGIRVNSVSAGPIMTPAARAIPEFKTLYEQSRERAPLKRHVDLREVANTVMFLCSDLSRGTTGEIIHVDCGYNIMGM